MIKYLYLGDYPDYNDGSVPVPDFNISTFRTNAEMYALGDKYDIQGLKRLSAWKFQTGFDAIKDNFCELLKVIAAIPIVYRTTPDTDRTLRDIILTIARRDWERLAAILKFKDLVADNPSFAIDLIKKMSQLPERVVCKSCKSPYTFIVRSNCGCDIPAKVHSGS